MTFPPRGPSLLVFAILMIPCISACDLISAKPDEKKTGHRLKILERRRDRRLLPAFR